MKQTKIVCSISDFRCDVDFLRKLFFAGMNVVRMNTAHASAEGIKKNCRKHTCRFATHSITYRYKGTRNKNYKCCKPYSIQNWRNNKNIWTSRYRNYPRYHKWLL